MGIKTKNKIIDFRVWSIQMERYNLYFMDNINMYII